MTWPEFAAARQLLAEERVGTRVREAAEAEDAAFSRSKDKLAERQRRHLR